MFFLSRMLNNRLAMPSAGEALPGRARPVATAARHAVSKTRLKGPYPEGSERAVFGMGRFRAAERLFWRAPGVHVTAAGYAGGFTPNPTHQEVETGLTGHAEVVLVVFDPVTAPFTALLTLFWEHHDPTQAMQQGADIGTMVRSVLYTTTEAQLEAALRSRDAYQAALTAAGLGRITTDVAPLAAFHFAETPHQQYLARNRGVEAALRGTGVTFPATDPAGA